MASGSGHQVLSSEQGLRGSALTDTLYAGNHITTTRPTPTIRTGRPAPARAATYSARITFDGNDVDHNNGPGLGRDIACSDIPFKNNRIYSNEQSGTFFEISTVATVTGNIIWDNGWAGTPSGWGARILIASSGSVEVTDNTLAWNADRISVISQGRNDRPTGSGTDITVSGNNVLMAPQPTDRSQIFLLAWLDDWSTALYAPASHNRGSDNRYWFSEPESSAERFHWMVGLSTLVAFQSAKATAI